MIISKATVEDALHIVQNNMFLAEESEGEHLVYDTVLKGVHGVLTDDHKGFYLVAKAQNDIIGQLMITFEWSDWRNENIWWVQSVYVSKDHRHTGVFTKLLQEVKQRALKQNVSLLRLYVHTQNTHAIRVYHQSKWQEKTYQFFEKQVKNL